MTIFNKNRWIPIVPVALLKSRPSDAEAGAAHGGVKDRHAAAMPEGDLPDNGQPQAMTS